MNGTVYSAVISKKGTTLRGIPKFSEIFFAGISDPFDSFFLPEFSIQCFAFRKFSDFLERSQEMSVPFILVSGFSKISAEWNAPLTR